MAKLSAICEINMGQSPESSSYNEVCNGLPFFQGNADFGEIHPSVRVWCTEPKKIAKCNDILISVRAPIGALNIANIECCIGRGLAALTVNDKICDRKFLWYALESNVDFLVSKGTGSTFKAIGKNVLYDLEIPLPSLETQKQIAATLDKVTDLINKRKQQLEKLEELVKSRFVEMFGDPKLNDKGWKRGVVSDYFEVKGGKRIPKGMGYSERKTDHPYLRATDMKNETIIEDDIHYIDDDVFQHIKRYTVKGGDIYLTNVGVNLGMAGVIPKKFDGASLTENAVKLVPKTERLIDGLFLAHYINSPGIQEYINERKMSVGVPKLAIFRIETMPLLIPPMNAQQEFNTFVESVDRSKQHVKESLEKLEILKKSLMQKYFG